MSAKQAKQWFTVVAKDNASDPVEILIHDQIGKDWWTGDGVASKDFADALKEIPKDRNIVVGINSPGGSVWDGLAIYNLLNARKDKVTTRVDGVAASAASIIMLAGHEVSVPASALVMIHRASSVAMGNAEEMLKMASDLEKHDNVLSGIYQTKTGKSKEAIDEAMRNETWFNGTEAKAFGLADVVTDTQPAQACAFDFKAFRNVPEKLRAATVPAAQPTNTAQHMENNTSTAVAAEPQKPLDLTPVVDAIKALSNDIKTVTAAPPGAAPVASIGSAQNLGDAHDKYKAMAPGAARREHLIAAWSDIRKAGGLKSQRPDGCSVE